MKIKVMGDSVRLKSALTVKDFELLNKFNKPVVVVDEEDNEVFRVNFKKGTVGGINEYGITYNSVDEDGAVYVTITFPGKTAEELTVALREEMAIAINNVQIAEQLAGEVLEEVEEAQKAVEEAFED